MIDEFYPGSKKKRKSVLAEESVVPDPDAWDSRPFKKVVNGVTTDMFTIGALAKALGRPVSTLRMWMARGYLPNSPYRLPPVEVNGTMRKNRRLYTRPMIESTIDAFDKRRLLGSARIEWSERHDLKVEILEAWKALTNNPK